jgi:MoaA/NifB/PqqE/SkfB family radical SAM enzyme
VTTPLKRSVAAIELQRLEEFLEATYSIGERIEAFRARKLFTAEIEVSRRCALQCSYCYNSSTAANAHAFEPGACWRLLDELAEYGVKEIYWLGGEPFEWPYFVEALERATSLGLRNVVFTNASRLDGKAISALVKHASWLSLHLDTLDPDIFAQLHLMPRRVAEHELARTLANVDQLLAGGFLPGRIRLAIVLSNLSLPALKETLAWGIQEKNFHTANLITLASLGRGERLYKSLALNSEELHVAYNLRAEVEARKELLRLGPTEFCKHYELTNFYVDVYGNVFPYVGVTTSCGNILRMPVDRILDEQFDTLSFASCVDSTSFINRLHGICGSCENSRLCFGTRTYSLLAGDLGGEDPLCWWG